ncbi:MAG TPA: carbamoyltransferase C-terminal domain-containing protein [Chitinophagaceae bacterium]|nr:carbamoyltransferase C-terminal domain-containing protein [Chitinophagaceae bacterium]
MIILGINAYHADSSAAIFVDGRLIAAIEEERFRRVKHWAGFPHRAIEFCIKEAGIKYAEVDYFTMGRDPKAKFLRKLLYLAKNPYGSFPAIRDRLKNSNKVRSFAEELSAVSGISATAFKDKIRLVEHHRSHLASAFFASSFEEAACISIDGSGDFTTTMTAVGKGDQIKVLDSIDFPHSLGLFYTAFTQFLGFPHYGDEYKVMGLAPYGKPEYANKLKKIVRLTDDGLFRLDLEYFRKGTQGIISYGDNHIPVVQSLYSKKIINEFGEPRKKAEPLTEYHKNLAASVQKVTEDTIFYMMEALYKKTGLTNICFAGGVAQNSVANGKIKLATSFKQVYIPSAGHDAGISIGAALYVHNHLLRQARGGAIYSAYTGSHFTNEQIKEILSEQRIKFCECEDHILYDKVADCIINGGVVGWFAGRAEFGPRALGGRSILADPRRQDAKDILNLKIKRRESFRPFAPSILKEFVREYFEINEAAPFMEKVLPVKKDKQPLIPAVTHVDGSGRLQTVDKDVSPRYYALIDTFRKKTGIPILVNTSFNENEPIVNTPEDALACYLKTDMDMLVMENIVIARD